jgi:glycosyltransferase involved in cell wall biosynthesis
MTPKIIELTILMPCLNEAETIVTCIEKAKSYLARANIEGEVLIADNGSTDGSQSMAIAAGARVVDVPVKGYGSALINGINTAYGQYVIMGDADDSYDFSSLDPFVSELRKGKQLVMGNRFAGGIMPGAMPPLHRYLGNPVLSFIGRLLFRSPLGDFHCGLRGFSREAISGLKLASPGMEFASEMIVKATLAKLTIAEVPTVLSPDGRSRPPHLRSWRDGWRHLRFLLVMSPRWLLLYPGLFMLLVGVSLTSALILQPLKLGEISFDIHTMLYASGAGILGSQLVLFSILSRTIGLLKGILPPTPPLERLLRLFTLERGLILGLLIILSGLGLAVYSVDLWLSASLAKLDPRETMRIVIPSVTLMIMGAEILFTSFILTFIDPPLEKKN